MLPDETFAPCRPTAYVWVRVRLCFHPRPLGAPPFLRAVRRAYMEPSRWRLKVSPTWKGGGTTTMDVSAGSPALEGGADENAARLPPTLVTSNHCTPIAFIPHFFGTHVVANSNMLEYAEVDGGNRLARFTYAGGRTVRTRGTSIRGRWGCRLPGDGGFPRTRRGAAPAGRWPARHRVERERGRGGTR